MYMSSCSLDDHVQNTWTSFKYRFTNACVPCGSIVTILLLQITAPNPKLKKLAKKGRGTVGQQFISVRESTCNTCSTTSRLALRFVSCRLSRAFKSFVFVFAFAVRHHRFRRFAYRSLSILYSGQSLRYLNSFWPIPLLRVVVLCAAIW